MPPPFPQDVQFQLQPAGPIVSFDSGPFQGRIYQNSGHIELAGPDLAGNANANLIHFAPPAAKTAQGPLTIGAVMSSAPVAGGVELKQKAGGAVVTTRLTFPHEGVMRYEVTDWGGIVPLATAVAAPSDNQEHFYGFGEKFDAFDQAGNKVHILTFDDPGVKKEHAYKVSPWFISTRGYGLHLDSSAESLFRYARRRAGPIRNHEPIWQPSAKHRIRASSYRHSDALHRVYGPAAAVPSMDLRAVDLIGYLAQWRRGSLRGDPVSGPAAYRYRRSCSIRHGKLRTTTSSST